MLKITLNLTRAAFVLAVAASAHGAYITDELRAEMVQARLDEGRPDAQLHDALRTLGELLGLRQVEALALDARGQRHLHRERCSS